MGPAGVSRPDRRGTPAFFCTGGSRQGEPIRRSFSPSRRRLAGLALLALVLGALTGVARGQDAGWKAGLAKTVITPETGVWLAGYGTRRPPEGKLHDLWMKALALEDTQGQRAVLVTSDFQGVPKDMSDRVFAQLRKKLKLTPEEQFRRLTELQPFTKELRHVGRSAGGRSRIAIAGASINIVRFAFMARGSTAHVFAARGQSAERSRPRAGWRRLVV